MKYWLMKTEPKTFGIEDLKAKPDRTEHWDGVRNYQARNYMRDEMKVSDRAFLYHSNCAEPGVVGVLKVTRAAYPDFTAFDPESPYYDPKSSTDNPRWFMVDVRLLRELKRLISLQEIKSMAPLRGMPLVQRGNRLSIIPGTPKAWGVILTMEKKTS